MSKRVLSYVIGSNGAGKSTLARNVLGPHIVPVKLEYGYLSVSEDGDNISARVKNIVAVGRYTSACGGVDTVKPLCNAYHLASSAAEMYPSSDIFMESLILSGVFNSPVRFLLDMKYERGFDVEVCFLFASLKESLRRVFGRNGGTPIKPKCVGDKLKSAVKTYRRFAELGEFRCIAIDTTKIGSDDIFGTFRNWSGLYEKNA